MVGSYIQNNMGCVICVRAARVKWLWSEGGGFRDKMVSTWLADKRK